MWGYDGWTQEGVRQDALRVHPSGEVVGLNWDALVTAVEGSFRELRAKVVTDRQSSRLVLLDRQGGETVAFQSPRYIGPRVLLERGAAVLMTYPPVHEARPAAEHVHLVNLGD